MVDIRWNLTQWKCKYILKQFQQFVIVPHKILSIMIPWYVFPRKRKELIEFLSFFTDMVLHGLEKASQRNVS